jgi:hypothetical protein
VVVGVGSVPAPRNPRHPAVVSSPIRATAHSGDRDIQNGFESHEYIPLGGTGSLEERATEKCPEGVF